ncbi:MAG: DUF4388 domain-containing protein, partial [Deltaproteobacteria bacterium]|nr:DUF4388 domain-containing protein [Deltaproteobacteria bacterium]
LTHLLASQGDALPLELVVAVVTKTLDGLARAHLASMAESGPTLSHGDLSPAHILITVDGDPMIISYETPRGARPMLPVPASLDISVPAAILYSHLQRQTGETEIHTEVGEQRRRLVEALEPIVRRGLGLDAKRAYRAPGDLRDALRGCLDFARFPLDTGLLAVALDRLSEVRKREDSLTETAQSPLPETPLHLPPEPAAPTRTRSHPGLAALDVGIPGDLLPPGLPFAGDASGPKDKPIPMPIDFGAPTSEPARRSDLRMAHPLPRLEVRDGNEALPEEAVRMFNDLYAEILDPFDDRSAEFAFEHAADPFGFDISSDPGVIEGERSRMQQRIGNVLVDLGFCSFGDVRRALNRQGRGHVRLGEFLIMEGVINEDQLVQALAVLHDARAATPEQVAQLKPEPDALAALPATFVAAHRLVPLAIDRGAMLAYLLVVDPSDSQTITEARVLLNVNEIKLAVSNRDAVDQLIGRLYATRIRTEVSSSKATVMLVGSDEAQLRPFAHRLRAERFVVEEVTTTARAARALEVTIPAALIVCVADPAEGVQLLRSFRERPKAQGAYAALVSDSLASLLPVAEELRVDLVPLPLRIDYIVSKIRRSLAERQSSEQLQVPSDGVSGSLDSMNLIELAQILRLGRKTAAVAIRSAEGEGRFVMREGNLYHAEYLGQVGDEAFMELCSVGNGSFAVTYSDVPGIRRTVFDSTEALLIEAARRSWFSEDDGGET